MIPGLSESVMPLSSRTTCWPLVTAGSSPMFAIFRFASVFTSVDFPTFGMPTIIARAVFRPRVGTATLPQTSAMRLRVSAAFSVVMAMATTLPLSALARGALRLEVLRARGE